MCTWSSLVCVCFSMVCTRDCSCNSDYIYVLNFVAALFFFFQEISSRLEIFRGQLSRACYVFRQWKGPASNLHAMKDRNNERKKVKVRRLFDDFLLKYMLQLRSSQNTRRECLVCSLPCSLDFRSTCSAAEASSRVHSSCTFIAGRQLCTLRVSSAISLRPQVVDAAAP